MFLRLTIVGQDPALYDFPSRGQSNSAPLLLILDRAGLLLSSFLMVICSCAEKR